MAIGAGFPRYCGEIVVYAEIDDRYRPVAGVGFEHFYRIQTAYARHIVVHKNKAWTEDVYSVGQLFERVTAEQRQDIVSPPSEEDVANYQMVRIIVNYQNFLAVFHRIAIDKTPFLVSVNIIFQLVMTFVALSQMFGYRSAYSLADITFLVGIAV